MLPLHENDVDFFSVENGETLVIRKELLSVVFKILLHRRSNKSKERIQM